MLIEELKKKYDGKAIAEIESGCKKLVEKSVDNRKEFILGLYYLERTKRFKENKIYANSTFESYIRTMYNLRYNTYNKERFGFIAHPAAAQKWGVGLIAKIQNVCGAGKVSDVMGKIDATKNITHEQIGKIIGTNAKERPVKPLVETKRDIETENIKRGKTIAEYIQTINEKDAQIARMRQTILTLKAENEELKIQINKYKQGISNIVDMPIFNKCFEPAQQQKHA